MTTVQSRVHGLAGLSGTGHSLPSLTDQALDRKLHRDGVPLPIAESASWLATLRRLARSAELPPLPKIRSLAYFLLIIQELQQRPLPDGYLDYLLLKLRRPSQNVRLGV